MPCLSTFDLAEQCGGVMCYSVLQCVAVRYSVWIGSEC